MTHGNDIVAASRRVIARRMALGMAAAVDPTGADRVEFARMIPEKVEAFSTAGMIMLKQSGTANQQMIRLAFGEVMTAARATIEMAGCFGPVALAEAQGRLTRAWFSRATSSFIAMSALILTAQAAVMAPIREAVIANADRLGP